MTWLLLIGAPLLWITMQIADLGLWAAIPFWMGLMTFNSTAWWKRRSLGNLAILIGGGCNALVILANGGYMPFYGESSSHAKWIRVDESEGRLLWLSDRSMVLA